MSSHPGVEVLRAMLAESGLTGGSILERRAAMDAASEASPAPEGTQVEQSDLGGVATEWLVPDSLAGDAASAPVVVHLHGGGYCMGGHDTHRGFAGRLALAAQARVAVPDYRLAPEHPFPAALEDAVAAVTAVLEGDPGPGRVAVSGDSAGGGLALATMLELRGRGAPMPAAAVLVSPWADLTQSAESHTRLDGLDPLLVRADLDQMAEAYLAGHDARDPRVSPVRAKDLAGLPPLCIEVGDQEVLLDDSTTVAALARRSGIDVSLTVWPELTHDFQIFPPELIPESDRSIEAMGRFIWRHIGT